MDPKEQLMQVTNLLSPLVEGTDAEQLDNETPCSDFRVRDLIGHFTFGRFLFAAGMSGDKSRGDELLGSMPQEFGDIEVIHHGLEGGLKGSTRLTTDFQQVDFSAIRPLMLPKEGFPGAPYHTCASLVLRLGRDGSELPIVSHLIDSRESRRGSFGKISDLDDPDGWPYFLWKGKHFKEQPQQEKFVIKKGRLWEGFRYLDSEISDTIKRVQHERYTSVVPTRAWFGYKDDEFVVNWFHLDEYGWKVNFSD